MTNAKNRSLLCDLAFAKADGTAGELAFKWYGEALSQAEANAMALADYAIAWRVLMAVRGLEATDPPEAVAEDEGPQGNTRDARHTSWMIAPAMLRAIEALPLRARSHARLEAALCATLLADPALRLRPDGARYASLGCLRTAPHEGWGPAVTAQYLDEGVRRVGPHFPDANIAVTRAILALALADPEIGKDVPEDDPPRRILTMEIGAVPSATLKAALRTQGPFPEELRSLLKKAGLDELARDVAACAASPTR